MRISSNPRKSLHTRAGFTLIELMVVVTIIGISATVATPSMIRLIQDRRTQKDAVNVLAYVQEARGRSIGRGAAVRFDYTKGVGYVMSEAALDINADGTPDVPSGNCAGLGVIWSVTKDFKFGASTARTVTQLDVGAASDVAAASLCFTPRGRLMLLNGAAAWVPVTQVHSFHFLVADGGVAVPGALERWVHVAPNGIAKMEL